jgi:hypothetical protein
MEGELCKVPAVCGALIALRGKNMVRVWSEVISVIGARSSRPDGQAS